MLRKHRPGVVEAFADAGPAIAAILGKAPAVSRQGFRQGSVNQFKITVDKEFIHLTRPMSFSVLAAGVHRRGVRAVCPLFSVRVFHNKDGNFAENSPTRSPDAR